jgi:citrate lyase subunit beta/citryl-CoA lyase
MTSLLARARSFLFVPASRPERFAKAMSSGADCVILDLEDAVPAAGKVEARELLAAHAVGFTPAELSRTLVRINPVGTSWHAMDLRLVGQLVHAGMAGVMVPKAESAADLRVTGVALGPNARLVPLIESLAGLDALPVICATKQVTRLAFGHLDFQLDIGMRCSPEERELDAVRFTLVAASRRAGLPAPIDGVTTDTTNQERLLADSQRSLAFGFKGKLCIHPAQVARVNETLSPSAAEVDWARRVLDGARSHEGKTFTLDGRMVDLPVIRLAEQTLQLVPA